MQPLEIDLNQFECVWKKPETLTDVRMHYCPGCGHGVIHTILMEVIEELGITENVIGIAPVGCSVFAYNYMNIDMQEAAHGRACAVATGIKRVLPDKLVFTYQGDGDFAAIGTAESIHASNRGENFLVVFINNGIYGMTGGQMAPTSIIGMKTSTSPFGREKLTMGVPIKITELLALLSGTAYVTRQAIFNPNACRQLHKALTRAFHYQQNKLGTCIVEVVSNCPSNWKMTPQESNDWLVKNMLPIFPLGDIKVPEGEVKR